MEKKIIKKLKKNEYLDMPILIKNLLKLKKKIKIFPLYEYWADVGHFDELKKVKEKLSKH